MFARPWHSVSGTNSGSASPSLTPVEYGWSLPVNQPDRCAAVQEEGREQLSNALRERAQNRWMERIKSGDLEGPPFPVEQYLQLRGAEVVCNPRQTE